MTVPETIVAFKSVLGAMYANPRKLAPLAVRYRASELEVTLRVMVRQHCKQHNRASCDYDEHFKWRSTGLDIYEGHGDGSDDSDGPGIRRSRSFEESKILAHELQTPEYQLCQT